MISRVVSLDSSPLSISSVCFFGMERTACGWRELESTGGEFLFHLSRNRFLVLLIVVGRSCLCHIVDSCNASHIVSLFLSSLESPKSKNYYIPHSLQRRKKVTLSLEGQIEPLRFRHSSSSEPRPLSPQFNHPLRSLLLFPLDLFLLLSLGVVGGGRGGGEEGGGERRGKGSVTFCAGGFGST